MLEAKRCIEMGVECPHLIIAGEQSQGRGRYGRIWFSPKGNLYMTLIQPITHPPDQISIVVAVAVAQVLKRLIGCASIAGDDNTLTIKPPNDILVNGQKIAGILIEEHDPFYSIGIGINVVSSPLVQSYETTFLHRYNKNVSIGFLLRLFLRRYHILLKQDFISTQDQYNKLSLYSSSLPSIMFL